MLGLANYASSGEEEEQEEVTTNVRCINTSTAMGTRHF
jgi:hypothetical protein